ncbi:helix-turn-helix domain-containing protein [Pseudomonas sp. 18173]|uniref:helix-turn-helix domain-containing protein n=1 Tax=Pseudomonas sp. 18173 TaxID=3390055 RepID=UPI003D1D5897
MGIGERLKEERERLGFNQTEFAAKAGASKNSQYNYEKGERSPDAAYLAAVAEKGVDVLYVVTGERRPVTAESISADTAKFLEVFQHIGETDREVLFRMASAFAKAASIDARKENN